MAGINAGTPEVAVGEPVKLGTNGEYELEHDPISDKLVVRDTVNGTEAYIRPETTQGLGQKGAFLRSLIDGEPLADDGRTYATIQEAEQAANGWMFIPPGTFAENVVVTTDSLTIAGGGYGTVIDGGTTGHALNIQADDVTVRELSVQTAGGNANAYHGVYAQNPDATLNTVTVRDADGSALFLQNGGITVVNCRVEMCDDDGIRAATEDYYSRNTIVGCHIAGTATGIWHGKGDDAIVANNVVTGCTNFGIGFGGASNDCVCGGNRIHNSGDHGIHVGSGADNLVFNNRISGSTNADLDDGGTNTLTDANVTGAAN